MPVESPEVVRAALPKIRKDIGALEEKRPLLRKKCLERAEVNYGGIDFDLAKVGINGCIECKVTAYAVLDVEPRRAKDARAIVERIGRHRGPNQLGSPDRVRHQVQMTVSLQAINALQIVHARRGAAFLLWDHLQPHRLILPMDISRSVDSPDLVITWRKSKL